MSPASYRTAYAWGRNDYGQLFLGNTDFIGEPRSIILPGGAKAADKVVIDVACGARHTVMLCENNELYTAGSNDAHQRATSDEDKARNKATDTPHNPTKVRFPDIDVRRGKDALIAVACGTAHTLALARSGRVFSWGANDNGQLGLGHFTAVDFPAAITALGTQVRCFDVCDPGALVRARDAHYYFLS